jgi:hypothetical protein
MIHRARPTAYTTGRTLAVGHRHGPVLSDFLQRMARVAIDRCDQSSARGVSQRYAEASKHMDRTWCPAAEDHMREMAGELIAHPASMEMVALARDTVLVHGYDADTAARWARLLAFDAWRTVLGLPA